MSDSAECLREMQRKIDDVHRCGKAISPAYDAAEHLWRKCAYLDNHRMAAQHLSASLEHDIAHVLNDAQHNQDLGTLHAMLRNTKLKLFEIQKVLQPYASNGDLFAARDILESLTRANASLADEISKVKDGYKKQRDILNETEQELKLLKNLNENFAKTLHENRRAVFKSEANEGDHVMADSDHGISVSFLLAIDSRHGINDCKISAAGDTLVTGGEDCVVKIFDVKQQQLSHTLLAENAIVAVDIENANGNTPLVLGVGCGNGKNCKIWGLKSGKCFTDFRASSSGEILCAVFTGAQGGYFVTGDSDNALSLHHGPVSKKTSTNVPAGSVLATIDCRFPVTCVIMKNDSKSVLAGLSNNSVVIWDYSTGKMVDRLDKLHESGRICSIHKHPINDYLLLTTTTEGCFSVTDLRNSSTSVIQNFETELRPQSSHGRRRPYQARFSPKGQFISICTRESGIRIYDCVNLQEYKLIDGASDSNGTISDPTSIFDEMIWHPDGMIAAVRRDGRVECYSTRW